MTKIGLFFGTQTGNTETIAETMQRVFGGDEIVKVYKL
jgi:flavodoxin I